MKKVSSESREKDASDVYTKIVQYVDRKFSIPSNRDLADMLSISTQRIIAALARLESEKKIKIATQKVHANPQRQITLCCDGRSTPWPKLKPRVTDTMRRKQQVSRRTAITRRDVNEVSAMIDRGEVAVKRYDASGKMMA